MPGSQYQVQARMRLSHSLYSLTESSDGGHEDEGAEGSLRLTPLQKLTVAMCKDEKTIKELIIGCRVGFYKVRGEIGYGTFSRVKLAFHALTKGRRVWIYSLFLLLCLLMSRVGCNGLHVTTLRNLITKKDCNSLQLQ
uniref:Protein kinase domain-containing protein n=1 Tax=Fundulus heteroclitus TaxID=8078 RepID=A0A3Q2PKY4_FUNHE